MSATSFFQPGDARATIATGDGIDVRHFSVRDAVSELFEIELTVVSTNLDIDFDEVIGNPASFALFSKGPAQAWSGLCKEMEQIRVDDQGLATYRVTIVPRAWLLTQRKNYRIFQYQSELEIVKVLLGEWGVEHEAKVDAARHVARKFRVQYGETDFAFVSRMLEDAGISYYFEAAGETTKLVLDDAPDMGEVGHPLVRFHDRPDVTDGRFVTHLAVHSRLRPGTMTIHDIDYRRPSLQQPKQSASAGLPQESRLEQLDYEPGAFLYTAESGGKTPFADDRGTARTNESIGRTKTTNRLHGKRNDAKVVEFDSDILGLRPGQLLSIANHPHRTVQGAAGLLVTRATIEADYNAEWRVRVESVPSSVPYRPAPKTPKPLVTGLESATVVGPGGEEIHTDEYGRVRLHFHWDRESGRDEKSSCWVPTNQPWAGQGYGAVNLPRVGQEVVVEFMGGDPDRPIIIGRVYTEPNPPPDPLPRYKNVTGIFSESSPRLVMGASGTAGAGANQSPFGGTPMSPQQINDTVTQAGPFQAQSPTGVNHAWNGSGMKIDDTAGSENLYIQANRDLHMIIRNNWTTVIGNHRATKIGTDDILQVRENQGIIIDNEQTTEVRQDSNTQIQGKRVDKVGKRMKQQTKENYTHESQVGKVMITAKKAIKFDAENPIQIMVGKSIVQVSANEIMFQSAENKLAVNPDRDQSPSTTVQGIPEAQADVDRRNAAEAATMQKGADTLAGLPQNMQPRYGGGENAYARQALSDAGITDRATQDQVLDNYFRRNSLDMQ
ncbi:MAG: type VI secretion system tip protein VgrG [Polyangiaceae bacterium]|nr:type VI secretion system tip protein VgrG [Polyangiaceae bacterium]